MVANIALCERIFVAENISERRRKYKSSEITQSNFRQKLQEEQVKKLASIVLSMAVLLGLAMPAMAADTAPTPAGYVTISVAANTLGLGFIEEPIKIPFYEGENYAQLSTRYFAQVGRAYDNTGTAESGFYLSGVQDNYATADARAVAMNIPQYILTAAGQSNEDYISWGGSDGLLNEFDYSQSAGWMYSVASQKAFPGEGASNVYPVDGDVIRWQFTLYGLGADLGDGAMNSGATSPIVEFVDRDGLMSVIGAINAASNKAEILAQEGVGAKFDEALNACLVLDAYTQEQINTLTSELSAMSGVGADYIAAAGTAKTTLPGAVVIPGQAADLGGETDPTDPVNPIKDEALAHLDTTLAFMADFVSEPSFGTGAGEWTIISLARGGYAVPQGYYEGYLERVGLEVAELMEKYDGKLDRNKLTEHSRLIMALSALGLEPYDMNGYDILAALADYQMTIRQGINGPIFGLIAMDTNSYVFKEEYFTNISEADKNSRTRMLEYILSKEIAGGGFALSGSDADPDITAMALQAFSAYYTGNELLRAEFGADESGYNALIASVQAAADRAIAKLSEIQLAEGGYASWGTENIESSAQVAVALTSFGIDPLTDERFIKNGNTLIDAIMKYAIAGGGFSHTAGSSLDGMATDQGTYALVALDRFYAGESALYDMQDAFEGTQPLDEGVSILLPEKVEGAQGSEFNAVVQVGSWTDETLKLIDGVFSVPQGLEVVDVTMGGQLTGGEVNYNLADGKLRFAYMSSGLEDVVLNGATFPAELMTITLRFTEEVSADGKIAITAESINLRSSSDAAGTALNVSGAMGEVDVAKPVPQVTATARALYTGDGTDLIEENQMAVAVEFLNLPENSKVMLGETELLYSAEITAKKGVTTYVAIVDAATDMAQLDEIASYTITQEVHGSVTFADTNEDGVINAQDSLNTLSLWLRETPLESDTQILVSNVNADGAINTVDVLAIMEMFVNARELDIITR